MIYKTFVSTKVGQDELRFTVQYSADSEKEAITIASKEWPFPEYYQLAAREICQEEPLPI